MTWEQQVLGARQSKLLWGVTSSILCALGHSNAAIWLLHNSRRRRKCRNGGSQIRDKKIAETFNGELRNEFRSGDRSAGHDYITVTCVASLSQTKNCHSLAKTFFNILGKSWKDGRAGEGEIKEKLRRVYTTAQTKHSRKTMTSVRTAAKYGRV